METDEECESDSAAKAARHGLEARVTRQLISAVLSVLICFICGDLFFSAISASLR